MGIKEPLISILIPLYNVETFVEKCLNSLFENTIIKDCEVIICNDGSTDSSFEIVKKICDLHSDLNVVLIDNEKNQGLPKTRQILLDAAKGKYIICVDSDDYVEKNYLESLYNCAETNSADITSCNGRYENVDGSFICMQNMKFGETPLETVCDILLNKNYGYVWSRLIRRDFILQNNISWNPAITIYEDFVIIIKVLLANPKCAYVDECLYHYIKRSNSMVSLFFTERLFEKHFVAFQELERLFNPIKSKDLERAFLFRKLIIRYNVLFKSAKSVMKKNFRIFPETNKVLDDPIVKYSKVKILLMKLQSKSKFLSYTLICIYRFFKKVK